jgi:hypothetical protein
LDLSSTYKRKHVVFVCLNLGIENLFNEITAVNFQNSGKETNIQVHETIRTANRHDQRRTSSHHIIVKIPGVQNKQILNAA